MTKTRRITNSESKGSKEIKEVSTKLDSCHRSYALMRTDMQLSMQIEHT